ncbi:xyloglucan-specific galacturonosyltransferase 1-like [Diospyros lotus]|uniref:xyloglucan-specific galacturonosyltransferase 1-like n=1 Tax=Diospyros lotus TaxID=55363 RepID=UPI002257C27E|nr:xyloglucan-specific galacturonosyltransferase 1-like [Diospyros lotus]
MAVSVSKKKSRLPRRSEPREVVFLHSILVKLLHRLPSLLLLLILLFLWSSSATIISSNIVHLCVSSRKVGNLYCLSAGTQPNLEIPIPPVKNTSADPQITSTARIKQVVEDPVLEQPVDHLVEKGVSKDTDEGGLADAVKIVEEQLKLHRSWASNSNQAPATTTCTGGRGIYVYELPPKFNKDLMSQCSDMIPWSDLCKFLSNQALGEPIPELGKGWYQTHQYSLEPIFHSRVLKHPCRVYNEDEAKLFYVPYYGGLDILRWHFKNVSDEVKDGLGLDLVKWLESQRPWTRNSGKDHVLVLGKISWDFRRVSASSWGSRLLELQQMQNPIKLLIERNPWHVNEIGIPHPTHFHPRSDADLLAWQLRVARSSRRSLVSFAGAARPGSPDSIRSVLINQCTDSEHCMFLNCSRGGCDQPGSVIELFMESEFCLQPPGDSPTRKSVFDSLVAGCIPVLFDPFTAYYQYAWHLPEDHGKYSVFVGQDEVKEMKVNVVDRLMKISALEREAMRRFIAYELLPGLVYGDSNSELENFQDAFSIAMNNLLERVSRL